ncbi:MAG: hypothetical protein MUP67_01700, partial [Acidimicrobiia bacterium]|nr:hypothetical protein [Acidimicrobiia bacterium]
MTVARAAASSGEVPTAMPWRPRSLLCERDRDDEASRRGGLDGTHPGGRPDGERFDLHDAGE